VQKPLLEELKIVADKLKLDYEEEPEAKHPAAWWDESVGRLLVHKESKDEAEEAIEKAKLIKKMAKYMVAVKKLKKEKAEQKEKQAYKKPTTGKYQKPAAGRYQKPAGKYQKK
jgi:signal recognition particle subunit SEC65